MNWLRRVWRWMLGEAMGSARMRWVRRRIKGRVFDMNAMMQRKRAHAERKRARARKEAAKRRDGLGWFRVNESRLRAEGRALWMR